MRIVTGTGLMIILFLWSCTKDDDNSISAVTNTLSSGAWRIALYSDSGIVETADFDGYDFTFSAGLANTVIASNGTNSITGAWIAGYQGDDAIVNLDFGVDSLFNRLNESWLVIERTDVQLQLQYDSVDYLTFSKN